MAGPISRLTYPAVITVVQQFKSVQQTKQIGTLEEILVLWHIWITLRFSSSFRFALFAVQAQTALLPLQLPSKTSLLIGPAMPASFPLWDRQPGKPPFYEIALNASSRSSMISSIFSVPIERRIVLGLIPWSTSSFSFNSE